MSTFNSSSWTSLLISESMSQDAATQSKSKPCCAESVHCPSRSGWRFWLLFWVSRDRSRWFSQDRAQLSRGDYLAILKRGLAEADASSIKFWLEATVRHLRWRKVFSVLRGMAAPWPCAGASALYHVPFIFLDVYPLPPSLKTVC